MNMIKHIILCVESKHQAQLDQAYIDKTLKYFYKIDSSVKLTYCNINGKGNYNKTNLLKQIRIKTKQSSADETFVVYFIDTDNYDTSPEDKNLNEKIKNFCKVNGFLLVWFCRNIEEVYWHKSLPKNEKVKAVKRFNTYNSLQKATEDSLSSLNMSHKKSNILKIFDNILARNNMSI